MTPLALTFRISTVILAIILCVIFLKPMESARAQSISGPMDSMGTGADSSGPPQQSDERKPGPIPETGFVIEGLAGLDTSLSGSYGTTAGETVPYHFGTAPVWGVRAGKMLFPNLLAYLTVQQSFFSQNTHTVIGLGGNYYLPSLHKKFLIPYLNATFGASYNTYTGVNAQAGYAWLLGAGALTPISPVLGFFLEADLSYETAPTGINTSIGSPPGTISRVSDTWSVPVMIGIRYAF